MMENLTLFVSSSDSYEDCWRPFFFLLKKFWPGCDLPIVLNTETKSFAFEGLNITCTKTGKQRTFGKTFHAGLEQVNTDNIFLIMIDYFIMEDINETYLREAYEVFVQEQLDSLYLVAMTTIKETTALRHNICLVSSPGEDRFSFQSAFWKKESIKKYVLEHENPWLSECFGSRRYEYTNDRLAFVSKSMEPLKYLHTGALHEAKWLKETVPNLEELGVSLNWQSRGFYEWKKLSLAQRIERRRKTVFQEARSRAHLFGLKYGLISLDD
jgi:hypothetical protein